MRKTIGIMALCLGLLVVAGCVNLKQPSNRISQYALEYPPPEIAGLRPLPASLKIERFSVTSMYNTRRIIYREGSFKRDEYFYHKWRANPGDMVTDFLGRDIRNSGLFKAALPYGTNVESSFALEGSVDEFLEWDTPEGWKAVLALTIALTAPQEPDVSKRILFQKTYHKEIPLTEKNPQGLARAMSTAMEEVSSSMIRDIYSILEKFGSNL